MSLIRYHSAIVILFVGIIFSKAIEPIQIDSKETLKIYNKDRSYYRLIDNNLTYYIEGPKILNIYSRLAFPKMTKKIKSYEFMVFIDEIDSFNVQHHFRRDLNTSNNYHPGHAYTIAGKDVINIPKGQHRVELVPVDSSSKILIRATIESFKKNQSMSKEHIRIDNENNIDSQILTLKDNNLQYFSISNKDFKNKLFFTSNGPDLIKIISRTTFRNEDDKGYYQFKIREDNKLLSTHHMFSEISKGTRIQKNKFLRPSKYRTTFINVPDGEHKYEIELSEPDSQMVLFRLIQKK